jgi:hypothetical protein
MADTRIRSNTALTPTTMPCQHTEKQSATPCFPCPRLLKVKQHMQNLLPRGT